VCVEKNTIIVSPDHVAKLRRKSRSKDMASNTNIDSQRKNLEPKMERRKVSAKSIQ
jgi:hypothetical protein